MADGADSEANAIRNRGWMPKLETEFKNGAVFVAVGASHLFGRTGILSHMRSQGFTIKRLINQ